MNIRRPIARFTERSEQTLFGDADKYEIREATARQEALVESLNATIAAGETLQKELDAHASSQQSVYSFQLTVLGCVLSVLGFCSISIDALELLAKLRDTDGGSVRTNTEQQKQRVQAFFSGATTGAPLVRDVRR